MQQIPVAKCCPSCGHDDFRKVKAKRLISFSDDRICRICGTRYSPPTPRWAGILFVLIGAIFLTVGLLLAGFGIAMIFMGRPDILVIGGGIGLVVLGPPALIHGICALFVGDSV